LKKLLFLLLLVTSPAHAYVTSVSTLSADATVGGINQNDQNLLAVLNGSVEGSTDGGATTSNIAADTIFEINMADDANSRVREAELLGIGSDSVSGGTLTQNAVVESGCIPADDTDLSSDISACVAYVNGYRVSKGATANTYTASRDCYVDLSQTGVYTTTCVTNGATQPAVAANSVRLAKVVTNGTEITTITSVYTTRIPGLIIPANYRDGMVVSKESATVVGVYPSSYEINNTMITKTARTGLDVSSAGDYASGSSERAASVYCFVLGDDDGDIKLDCNDVPSYDSYGVSTTAGKLRYDTYHSEIYRALGWLYLDPAQTIENASNLKEAGLANTVQSQDTSVVSLTANTETEVSLTHFYNSGGNVLLYSVVSMDAGTTDKIETDFRRGSTTIDGSGSIGASANAGQPSSATAFYLDTNRPQAGTSYSIIANSASTEDMRRRGLIVREE